MAINIAFLLDRLADRAPGRPALVTGTGHRTWAEFRDRTVRLAGILEARGVGEGDRVALLCANRPEFVECLLAAVWLGAVIVPGQYPARGAGGRLSA